MKLALFGVGNAGIRLVDELCGAEQRTETPITDGNVLTFNTTPSTFAELDHVDQSQQVLIGDTHPAVYQPEEPGERSETDEEDTTEPTDRREGVVGDPELGAAVANEDLPEIRRALDAVDDTEVDAAMIVAGLGGGTGCGVGSVLLEELVSIYEIPIYVLGVLPSADEPDQRAWCAARAVRTFVPMADAVLPVDNEAWHTDETYDAVNEAVATRIVSLFGAGEREGLPLSELRMDPNDINRTLGVGGLSTIGYAQTELAIESDSWLDTLRRLLGFGTEKPEPQTDATTIKKLVERAVDSKLTLPCDISTADRVLLILSGPPRELSRKGFETGRSLLEDKTGTVEILAGDEPDTEATAVTATVLLSNVTGVSRIEQLQQRALAFQTEGGELAVEPADQPADTDTVDEQSAENDSEESGSGDHQEDDKADTGVGDETPAEADGEASIESDPGDGDKLDGSEALASEHGFRFDESDPADPEELIVEAEPTTDDSDADKDESADGKTAESTANETAKSADEEATESTNDETAKSEDDEAAESDGETATDEPDGTETTDSDDDPTIKDPFADGSATDEPSQ